MWPVMIVIIGLLMLRSTAENPETNLVKSVAQAKAREPAPVPDEENAAGAYRKAIAALPRNRVSDYDKDPEGRNAAVSPDLLRSVETQNFIKLNAPALQQIRNASRLEKCNWGTDYAKGAAAPMTYFGGLRRAVRLLALQAVNFAEQGNHAAAAENIRAVNRIVKHCQVDRTLIGAMVCNALRGINRNTVQMIVFQYCPKRHEEIAEYRDACVSRHDPWDELQAAMIGERDFILIGLDQLAAKRIVVNTSATFSSISFEVPLVPWYGSERKAFLAIMDDMDSNFQARRWNFINEPDEAALSRFQLGPVMYATSVVPVLRRGVQSALENAQSERVLDLGMAALQFRLKQGREIESTQELVPGYFTVLPQDIFHPDKPLMMRKDADGYFCGVPSKGRAYIKQPGLIRFYSTGRNGVDDDGFTIEGDAPLPKDEAIRAKYPNADDLTFAIPPFVPVSERKP